MIFRSIRFKITLFYMAILALTLIFFSVILYHYVSKSLYANMDSLLQSKADGIVNAINAYWAAERLGPMRYGVKVEDYHKFDKLDFATLAARWIQEKSKDPKLLDIIVQIFDADAREIVSSKSTQGITSVSEKNFTSVLKGKSRFDTLTPSFPTRKLTSFRVFITPVLQDEKVEYIVQVASPLASIQTALRTLKIMLSLLFPTTVFLTGIMGSFLARLTLKPVDEMIGTIHDITAENMRLKLNVPNTKDEIQKLAETFNDMLTRLDNAFTSQRQLFEDISHQLKTPLTILKGEFEVMLKKMRSPIEYEALLKSSLEEIDKIAKLAGNLLMLAAFESKKIMPDRRALDLNLLMQGVVNSIKMLADTKHIKINVHQHDNVAIIADDEQLKHLFLNLLDNAVKYTPPDSNGEINIDIEKDDLNAKIIITDTGIGIPDNKLSHVFERFFRVDGPTISKGFGLGLSIVKSIIDAHRGTIEVRSHLNEGTTFIIHLPLS